MSLDKKLNELYSKMREKWKEYEDWENELKNSYLEKWKAKNIDDIYQFIKYPLNYELLKLIIDRESKYYKLKVKTDEEYNKIFSKFLEMNDKKFNKNFIQFTDDQVYRLEDLMYVYKNTQNIPLVFLEASKALGLDENKTLEVFENYISKMKDYSKTLYEFLDLLTDNVVKKV